MTKAEQAKIYNAYAEFEQSCMAFRAALFNFKQVYNPNTVGLSELADQIDEVIADIDAELDSVL